MKIVIYILFILFIYLFLGCQSPQPVSTTPTPINIFNQYALPDIIPIVPETNKVPMTQVIQSFLQGQVTLADVVEEFSWAHRDDNYVIQLDEPADQYLLIFQAPKPALHQTWDADSMQFIIYSLQNQWLEINPLPDDIPQLMMLTQPSSFYTGNYTIHVMDEDRQVIMLDVPQDIAEELDKALDDSHETVNIHPYTESDGYYFGTDIRICVDQDGETRELDLLMNTSHHYVLYDSKHPQNAYAIECGPAITDWVRLHTQWDYISLNRFQNIQKATLKYQDQISTYTYPADAQRLDQLSALIASAQCIGYTPKTMDYTEQLIVVTAEGEEIEIHLDVENNLMLLGSQFHYGLLKRDDAQEGLVQQLIALFD